MDYTLVALALVQIMILVITAFNVIWIFNAITSLKPDKQITKTAFVCSTTFTFAFLISWLVVSSAYISNGQEQIVCTVTARGFYLVNMVFIISLPVLIIIKLARKMITVKGKR